MNALIGGIEELIQRTVGPTVNVTVDLSPTLKTCLVDPVPAQPVHQRPRRPAGQRQPQHPHRRTHPARRAGRRRQSACRQLSVHRGGRRRHRHGRCDLGQSLRPLLHHQAGRPGFGVGIVDDLWLRQAVRRTDQPGIRTRPGHPCLPAAAGTRHPAAGRRRTLAVAGAARP